MFLHSSQVNKHMPRTFGDASVHVSHFDSLVEGHTPMPQHKAPVLTDVEVAIGKHIAENLVEDGATLQMGIGSIPDAVLAQLGNHKDLGIHSEMFSDGVVDLMATGAITNNNKVIHQGKLVSSFTIGTQKLFDWMHNNPSLLMLDVGFTNNPQVSRDLDIGHLTDHMMTSNARQSSLILTDFPYDLHPFCRSSVRTRR